MALRKSTKIWLAILAAGIVLTAIGDESFLGDLIAIPILAIVVAGAVIVFRTLASLLRALVHRTSLRLAFSYFLIGIVPIPLLAALVGFVGYLLASQFMGVRAWREARAIAAVAPASDPRVRSVVVEGDCVVTSNAPFLPAGTEAGWIGAIEEEDSLTAGGEVWVVSPRGKGPGRRTFVLVPLFPADSVFVQRLADATGYEVHPTGGNARTGASSVQLDWGDNRRDDEMRSLEWTRPEGFSEAAKEASWLDRWRITSFYLETAANASGERSESGENVALFLSRAPIRQVYGQLFHQGVAEVSRVILTALLIIAGILLCVYAVAVLIAFVLVGSLTRNVNRLTRASQAFAKGDFSARVNSKSRDQVGDLARSFDTMAASIQRLLAETAEQERLKSEIEVARAIQNNLLPPAEASLPGLSVTARFEPVAEIGGDYYDYMVMPDGRTGLAVGDVSGHGLPTGLLVAAAKAALSTLVEAGLSGGPLFARLNEFFHRSTDRRHFMTLTFFAWDPVRQTGELTNAGHLAPYRISAGGVEAISLPALPLGFFPGREFPSRPVALSPGDKLVFLTDGYVEAVDPEDEAFGFARVEEVLRNHGGKTPPEVADALLAAVSAHAAGIPPQDDRTVVIVAIGGEPA
ncbi:MAG TPA: SpoIIE family protein phosphatase [Thermoanaerobaculia bacterium]